MGFIEIMLIFLGIMILVTFLVMTILLTKKWGWKFLLIVVIGIYIFFADSSYGIAITFVVVMSYLLKKNRDFKGQ